jgi:hypothetical protein
MSMKSSAVRVAAMSELVGDQRLALLMELSIEPAVAILRTRT